MMVTKKLKKSQKRKGLICNGVEESFLRYIKWSKKRGRCEAHSKSSEEVRK